MPARALEGSPRMGSHGASLTASVSGQDQAIVGRADHIAFGCSGLLRTTRSSVFEDMSAVARIIRPREYRRAVEWTTLPRGGEHGLS